MEEQQLPKYSPGSLVDDILKVNFIIEPQDIVIRSSVYDIPWVMVTPVEPHRSDDAIHTVRNSPEKLTSKRMLLVFIVL